MHVCKHTLIHDMHMSMHAYEIGPHKHHVLTKALSQIQVCTYCHVYNWPVKHNVHARHCTHGQSYMNTLGYPSPLSLSISDPPSPSHYFLPPSLLLPFHSFPLSLVPSRPLARAQILLQECRRTASVTAKTFCQFFILTKDDLFNIISHFPGFRK